jgi:hypothetical protein
LGTLQIISGFFDIIYEKHIIRYINKIK